MHLYLQLAHMLGLKYVHITCMPILIPKNIVGGPCAGIIFLIPTETHAMFRDGGLIFLNRTSTLVRV